MTPRGAGRGVTLFQAERIRSRWDALPNATYAGRDRGWMPRTLLDLNSPPVAVKPLGKTTVRSNNHSVVSMQPAKKGRRSPPPRTWRGAPLPFISCLVNNHRSSCRKPCNRVKCRFSVRWRESVKKGSAIGAGWSKRSRVQPKRFLRAQKLGSCFLKIRIPCGSNGK